ncbi:DNA-binding response regulator, NarL/FixJ family, contains REC and HTH domains [Trujillonella endophytica]|uniref:DNA-binding response regulator, NarL/FixJ family, contains REC and HTH domains n=1 Tax=Trujillonella endophytica TaxID=673521 RepID=A0A1H8PH43_9ACTN|nr:DNA-binding response regulator, NarL/FixJ family, contains REC and HTH domains [Trujillella endophytica]
MLLVDDHSLFAQALQLGLAAAGLPADRVLPSSSAAVVAACAAAAPATVLLDLRLGFDPDGEPIDGLDLVGPVTAAGCRVVVVTGEVGDDVWGTAVERGAVTVVAKETALDDLVPLVRAVHAGERVLGEGRRQDLLAAARRARADEDARLAPFRSLTPREDEVLRCMAEGLPAATIASTAHVSEATVRTQIRAVLSKLQVSSQLQAVALARQAGWLDRRSDLPVS